MTQQNVQRADALVAGSKLHTYIVLKILGSSAFGITYLANISISARNTLSKNTCPTAACAFKG